MAYPRNLTFQSVYNFRDVGGYPGHDGRTVRWRWLFRADNPHRLDGDDWAAFQALGVRTVIDLRRGFEIEDHGRVREYDGLRYVNAVLQHVDWEEVPHPADVEHARWLADRYLNFAADGREGIATALRTIADPEAGPVVVHCMAGKDRTGVVCALALALAGVSDEDIAADYALTEVSMVRLTEYLRIHKPEAVLGNEHMFDSPAAAMSMFLTELRELHGSVEEYVQLLGLSADEISALRSNLLS